MSEIFSEGFKSFVITVKNNIVKIFRWYWKRYARETLCFLCGFLLALIILRTESKALEKVNQVLETDPNEPRAIFILGKILRVQGKNEEALFQFKKLVEMQSINMVQALEVIREIEIELKFKHVAPEKRKLVQQEITNYLSLCKKYISKYEYENAEECCNRIFELGYADIAKENLDIIKIFKMGDYYYSEVEEYEEAIRCYEKIYSNKDYMNEAYNRVYMILEN